MGFFAEGGRAFDQIDVQTMTLGEFAQHEARTVPHFEYGVGGLGEVGDLQKLF